MIDTFNSNRDFSNVYKGKKVVPDNLIKFLVTGSGRPYVSSIKQSNIDKKLEEWQEKNYTVKRLQN